jgi:hypothetical protein
MNLRLLPILSAVCFALVSGALLASAQHTRVTRAPARPLFTGRGPTYGTEAGPLAPVGSAFTYQGRLQSGGSPANGPYDLRFTLFDAATAGNQVGATVTAHAQVVSAGLFTVQIDFGAGAFQGSARWLEIAVRPTGGPTYTTLSPRQPLTAAPYAMSLMPGAYITAALGYPALTLNNTAGLGLYASSGTGAGVYGESTAADGWGVYGQAHTGTDARGVYGNSSSGSGVWGNSSATDGQGVYGAAPFGSNAKGVHGFSYDGYGVYGSSSNNTGVYGQGGYYGGYFVAGTPAAIPQGPGARLPGCCGFPDGFLGTAGVTGVNAGPTGAGVYGNGYYGVVGGSVIITAGTGVLGFTGMGIGVKGSADNDAGIGVLGQTGAPAGTAIRAVGHPVQFNGITSTALHLEDGGIKVTSTTPGIPGPIFVHGTNGCSTCNYDYIDNPYSNNDPTAIVLVTHNWNALGNPGHYNNHPVGVFYDSAVHKWAIFNEDLAQMEAGLYFNVMIVKTAP